MSGAGEGWRPIVSLAFRAVGGEAAYLDGVPSARVYVEKGDLEAVVEGYISEGRLTLEEAARPRLLEVEGGGGFYVALLESAKGARPRETHAPSMHPVTVYDEERVVLRLMRERRPHEFNELLASYAKTETGGNRPAWGKLRPYSPSAANVPRRWVHADDPLRSRTALILSGQPSMAEPWSLWGDLSKDSVAGFLCEALTGMYVNSALIRYGDAGGHADGRGNDINAALGETLALNPERVVVLADRLGPEPAAIFEDLSRSGVRVLVIDLGDEDKLHTGDAPSFQVLRLRAGGDLAYMMRGLAAWVYSAHMPQDSW